MTAPLGDLHMHSTLSDGTVPPDLLAKACAEAGVAVAALTDHDTLAGLPDFVRHARGLGVTVIAGIELSTSLDDGRSLHLLGYFAGEPDAARPIQAELLAIRAARDRRNAGIVAKLQGLGYDITLEEIEARAASDPQARGERSVGRPHIAQVLVEKGIVDSIRAAFDTLLARGRPAHVPRERLSVARGLDLLAASGGVGVVAHPIHLGYPDDAELERTLGELRDQGLWGLEVRHSDHDAGSEQRYGRLARGLGLGVTGGSDFHGDVKPEIALGVGKGDLDLSLSLIDPLREHLASLPVPTF